MSKVGPVAAVRAFCLDCQGGSAKFVRLCSDGLCPLWDWRLAALPGGVIPESTDKAQYRRAAMRAVRRQCMGCAGHRREVRACPAREDCPLWSWRFGVRPKTYKAVRRRFFAPRALPLF